MRKFTVLDGAISMERLDSRVSLTSLLFGGCHVPPVFGHHIGAEDDPLPAPEPAPGTDPGTSTPILTPPLSPSGPIAPGTS